METFHVALAILAIGTISISYTICIYCIHYTFTTKQLFFSALIIQRLQYNFVKIWIYPWWSAKASVSFLYTPWTLKIDWYFVESFNLAKRQTRENVGVKERSNGKGSDEDFDIEWLGLICERNWQGFFSSVDLFERISLPPPSPQQQQCEILWIVGTLWLCPHPADALAAKRLKGFSTDLPPPDQKYSICSNTAQGLFQIWWEVRSQGVAFSQINIGRRNEDGFDRNLLEVFAFAFSAGILHLPAPWQNICWRQTKDFLHIQTKDFSQVQTKYGSHVSADDC